MPEPQIPVTPSSAAASAKPGSSDHSSLPITLKRGSSVARSIRTRSIAPGAARWPRADLGALEGRPGRARGGQQPVAVAQDDLGVRADVDDQLTAARTGSGASARITAGRVGADVAGDARQDVDPGARVDPQAELGRRQAHRPVGGQRERRAAERRRVDPEQEVVHDRVAHDRQLEDVGRA